VKETVDSKKKEKKKEKEGSQGRGRFLDIIKQWFDDDSVQQQLTFDC
jgi:hypothetical protein